jgi:PAS domain S-box-containing protein
MSLTAVAMAPGLVNAIVEQCPDAMIFADREGVIRLWNRAAEALFGYSAAEALGSSLDVIIPERLRGAHWAGYRRAIAAGETKYGNRALTTRSARKDGGKLYVELSFALVKDGDGMVTGALATARDGTERYLASQALLGLHR